MFRRKITHMNRRHNSDGFTLIELLVVIAIIGLLASVVLVSVNGARVKARDVKRKADLAQLQKAIELYRNNDANNYPINGLHVGIGVGWWAQITNTCASWGQLYNLLAPTYVGKVPDDPRSTGPATTCTAQDGWWYWYGLGYQINGTTLSNTGNISIYVLCTKLENSSDTDYKTISNPWPGGWTLNYCINGG